MKESTFAEETNHGFTCVSAFCLILTELFAFDFYIYIYLFGEEVLT